VTGTEPDDREAWALTEQFDAAARDVGREPDRSVMAELVELGTEDMLFALLDALDEVCHGDAEAVARHYARHVEALAGWLPDEGRRAVLAVVDLRLGWMCAGRGGWSEARQRAERAGAHLAEQFPGLVPDLEALRAGVAAEEDRLGDARAHWEAARDGFATAEAWGDAACAAAGVAELSPVFTPAVLGEWRQAARWFLMAELPQDAQDCAERACGALAADLADLRPGAELDARELVEQTRKFALEQGLAVQAMHLRALDAAFTTESEAPWEQVHPLFEGTRDGYAGLDMDEADRRLALARLDMWQSFAAFSRSRYADSEKLLSRALPELRENGTAQEVELAEQQLLHIMRPTGPAPVGVDISAVADEVARAGALFAEGLRLANQGSVAEGVAALDEASRLYAEADGVDQAVAVAGIAGLVRAIAGDRAAGVAAMRRLEVHQAQHATTRSGRVMVAMASGMLRWGMATLAGDRGAALLAQERTEEALLEQQAGLPAAHLAAVRGQDLLAAGRSAEALRVVLPAVLAMDAHRCALPDARRRGMWAARVAAGFDTAYRAAAACGETRLLTELLEVGRGNAVPAPRPDDARDDAMSALGDVVRPEPAAATPGVVRSGAAAAAVGTERTALGLPARIRTPWGSVALAEHLEEARRYVDPNRADDTVEWRVIEN
jgi:hypothetical protein